MDDLLADIVADGEEENQVTVDAEESCFIKGGRSVGELKRSGVEGVRDGGTRSMPAGCRNLLIWGP